MAPTTALRRARNGVERVRARLLTALHVGQLRPGDRVLSVRRLAALTGLNRKTVHRAYASMAREGMLEVRPGSGTYVADRALGDDAPPSSRLLSTVNRCRAVASSLGLTAEEFASFVAASLGDGLRGFPVGVVECNREQIGLIALDLARAVGLAPVEIPISALEKAPESALRPARALVTTDCHLTEVARMAAPSGLPVHSVSLDAEFPRRLARCAGDARVVMIVRDSAFAVPFLRLLRNLSVSDEVCRRFRFVEPREAALTVRRLRRPTWVWVSPLVARQIGALGSPHATRVPGHWRVSTSALDRVRAGLAFDLVAARREHSGEAPRLPARRGHGGR